MESVNTLPEVRWVADSQARLDLFVSQHSGRSRAFAKIQIEQGNIRVNGESLTKASHKVRVGDTVDAQFIEKETITLSPVSAALNIIYEDEDCLVLNKPQGWVVHPASSYRGETIVHYLLHYFQNNPMFPSLSPLRPGIVHRLDRGTSGCLLVAKHRFALEQLSAQFKDRIVEKEYEAIVWGEMRQTGKMDSPIARHRTQRKKMTGKTGIGRDAMTRWATVKNYKDFSHVRLLPKTGRTHQLRVHLSESGHSIVGDSVYGKKTAKGETPIAHFLKDIEFPFLHAKRLVFFQPKTGEKIECTAEHPKAFSDFLSLLKQV